MAATCAREVRDSATDPSSKPSFTFAVHSFSAASTPQTGREVSVGKLQCFGEELLVPSGALSLSLEAVGGG
ncbi:MAG: hypothetical protein ABGZ35_04390, partial [Planctomycetaceae bacterium]